MKKQYATPDIKIVHFDTDDIICASSVPNIDTPDTLITIGVDTGDMEHTLDLMA